MKINVLGTDYKVRRVNDGKDAYMKKMGFCGYCDGSKKGIVLLNLKSIVDWFAIQFPKLLKAYKEAGYIEC